MVFPFELCKGPSLSVEEINTAREEKASKGGGVVAIADTCDTETNADIQMEGAEEGTARVLLRLRVPVTISWRLPPRCLVR